MVAIASQLRPARLFGGERRAALTVFCVAKALRLKQHGSAVIETALVLPLFFMLLFGIFTYSLILFGRGNAICAANLAARYAALHSSTAVVPSIAATVKAYAVPFLYGVSSPSSDVNVAYSAGNTIGGTVTVTVSITYPTGIPFYGGGNITISAVAKRTISR